MKKITLSCISVLFCAMSFAASEAVVKKSGDEDFKTFSLSHDPSSVAVSNDNPSVNLSSVYHERWRVVSDLNNDGRNDLILSDVEDSFGNGGGGWLVYFNMSNGTWKCVGDICMHPGAFAIDKTFDGVDLWCYSHLSAREGYVGYYTFTCDGMNKGFRKILVHGEDENDKNIIGCLGRAIFGYGHGHPYCLETSETSLKGVVSWKKIGDWRKPCRQDEIYELKTKLAELQGKLAKAEDELKITKSKLEMFGRGVLDVSGVELGSKWQNPSTNIVCSEVCSGFTNMNVSVTEDGFVKSIRIVRHAGDDGKGLDGITGGRFPSDEEQKIIHQAENHFHVRFVMDRFPGTYRWENPFERVKMRIDFRDKTKSVIEASYLKSFTE